jgi:hypothetical protein
MNSWSIICRTSAERTEDLSPSALGPTGRMSMKRFVAIVLAVSFATFALAPPVEKTIAVPERDQDVKHPKILDLVNATSVQLKLTIEPKDK